MAHPLMFDEADPVLARVRELALAYPDAAEKVSHGRPTFYTTKVFAYYGGSVKVDGAYRQHDRSVMVLLDPDERQALLEQEGTYVPAYLGPAGWIGVDLVEDSDWDEINELLDASYRRTAGVRRVKALDACPDRVSFSGSPPGTPAPPTARPTPPVVSGFPPPRAAPR